MLLVRDAENVLDAFNSEDGKATLEKHFCGPGECIIMEKDDLWLCRKFVEERTKKDGTEYEVERTEKIRHLGAMAALSTFYKQKGIERATAGYDFIFIDEFIQESRQADRVDTCRAFYRTLQSTLRTNPDAVVVLAANLINDTPLWNVFGCRPGKPGQITMNKEKGVIIEHCTPSPSWLEAHNKSVAGRLGVGDYNKDNKVNPNVRAVHEEKNTVITFTHNTCRKLTDDGNAVVWLFHVNQFNKKTGETHRFSYCTSDWTGEELFKKNKGRGMRCTAISRVTTFGYRRQPKSSFDPLANVVNDIIFESKKTLELFQRICK